MQRAEGLHRLSSGTIQEERQSVILRNSVAHALREVDRVVLLKEGEKFSSIEAMDIACEVSGIEYRYMPHRILENVRMHRVLDFMEEPHGKQIRLFLDRDGLKVFVALVAVYGLITDKSDQLYIPELISKTRQALGESPLRDRLHDPLPIEKKSKGRPIGKRRTSTSTIGTTIQRDVETVAQEGSVVRTPEKQLVPVEPPFPEFDNYVLQQLNTWGLEHVFAFVQEVQNRAVLQYEVGSSKYRVHKAFLQIARLTDEYIESVGTRTKPSVLEIDRSIIADDTEAYILTIEVRGEVEKTYRHLRRYRELQAKDAPEPTVSELYAILKEYYRRWIRT